MSVLVDPVMAATSGLTTRQVQILGLVAQGDTTEQLMRKLHISETSVNRHVSNAIQALGAKTRTHAVAIAYQTGIFTIPIPTREGVPTP